MTDRAHMCLLTDYDGSFNRYTKAGKPFHQTAALKPYTIVDKYGSLDYNLASMHVMYRRVTVGFNVPLDTL